MFVKMAERCSGFTSITSRINRIVSSDVNVDFPSNFRNDFISGPMTMGIV